MWSSILSSGEAAKERFASALKDTNDALSQRASEHAQQVKMSQSSSTSNSQMASADDNEKVESKEDSSNTVAFSFQSIGKRSPKGEQNNEIFDSLKMGWGSVVEVTKNVVETTKEAMEKEQTRIQASLFANGPYMRDLSLPLDSESLRDAEVVYLTDRLITMSHPAMQSPTNGDITPDRKLAAISHLLHKRHGGKFMVWNLSEMEYNYSILQDQVMAFHFPGSPSPPLGLMLKILLSIESWLKADERNVAVIHCLTGKGRTSTVMAAFLCWMGEAGFGDDPNKALEYIAYCKRMDPDTLTIPSQRRYVSYFKNMMDGVRPNQPPILLKRIIMSEAPKFGRSIQEEKDSSDPANTHDSKVNDEIGCSPYLQVFKAGKLVFTTAASKSFNQSKDDLPFCVPSDGSITFPVETIVQGDILIRCRHLTRKGQRVSMFRAAFHTGYTPAKVLRLSKAQLDGACNDKRYTEDFFIDLIFEECSTAMASKHLLSSSEKDTESHVKFAHDNMKTNDNVHNEAAARRMGGVISNDAVTITASAYDSMLHRDSRFWDVISERRKQIASGSLQREDEIKNGVNSIPFYGPTIGRRREFPDEMKSDKSSTEESFQSNDVSSHRSIQSFSIGGEMDFTVDETSREPVLNKDENVSAPKEAKKDDLMEALMAIDNDGEDTDADRPGENVAENRFDDSSEEIVFDVNIEDEDDNIALSTNDKDLEEVKVRHENKVLIGNDEIETNKSKSSCDASLVKIDKLDLDGSDSDQFDFDDGDEEELQDLEDFLTKAKT